MSLLDYSSKEELEEAILNYDGNNPFSVDFLLEMSVRLEEYIKDNPKCIEDEEFYNHLVNLANLTDELIGDEEGDNEEWRTT